MGSSSTGFENIKLNFFLLEEINWYLLPVETNTGSVVGQSKLILLVFNMELSLSNV